MLREPRSVLSLFFRRKSNLTDSVRVRGVISPPPAVLPRVVTEVQD